MGNCSQVCTNTIGSYSCSCMAGYDLNVENETCIGNVIVKCEYKSFQISMTVHGTMEIVFKPAPTPLEVILVSI